MFQSKLSSLIDLALEIEDRYRTSGTNEADDVTLTRLRNYRKFSRKASSSAMAADVLTCFKKHKTAILENDTYVWLGRGQATIVFGNDSNTNRIASIDLATIYDHAVHLASQPSLVAVECEMSEKKYPPALLLYVYRVFLTAHQELSVDDSDILTRLNNVIADFECRLGLRKAPDLPLQKGLVGNDAIKPMIGLVQSLMSSESMKGVINKLDTLLPGTKDIISGKADPNTIDPTAMLQKATDMLGNFIANPDSIKDIFGVKDLSELPPPPSVVEPDNGTD